MGKEAPPKATPFVVDVEEVGAVFKITTVKSKGASAKPAVAPLSLDRNRQWKVTAREGIGFGDLRVRGGISTRQS